ncbi:LOW QUALITY PROTEIN: hypothetical protein TorRG33x02_158790 [Trema orientale]|uniref:Uncharacterized protein n=1 Tax=Trema orientale TaxID=63057 RepID=A0A2P5ERZ8_TREOI|nr:LOW QUALITY PROTEIN: hypothetical protein TorRG33x02_158790 [Trema orientale]
MFSLKSELSRQLPASCCNLESTLLVVLWLVSLRLGGNLRRRFTTGAKWFLFSDTIFWINLDFAACFDCTSLSISVSLSSGIFTGTVVKPTVTLRPKASYSKSLPPKGNVICESIMVALRSLVSSLSEHKVSAKLDLPDDSSELSPSSSSESLGEV